MDRVPNVDVLKMPQAKTSVIKYIRKRPSRFFGHVVGRNAMEHLLKLVK